MATDKQGGPPADSLLKPPSQEPGGLEAPLAPSADPTRKTSNTSDPEATDPGNGAD